MLQLAFYLPDQGQHKAAGERGSAFFAGAYRHGGITRLRSSCRSWPWSIQAITRYIQQKASGIVFTSFAILYDQEAKPHRDSGNEATPNVVIKLRRRALDRGPARAGPPRHRWSDDPGYQHGV